MRSAFDVVVVGGGVIGLGIAREGARAGMSVCLLERGETGGEATGASAGMLAAQLEAHEAAPLRSLALRSRELYPDFVRQVEAEADLSVDLRREGAVVVALDEAGRSELGRQAKDQHRLGLEVETLSREELLRLEPAVCREAIGGIRLPHEHTLDPRLLAAALRRAAERAGAEIRTGAEVAELLAEHGVVRGVRTADGHEVRAREVVVAAGAWSGALAVPGMTAPPSEPVRGQMLCFLAPGLLRHVVASEDIYLVPRSDGRVLAGATMEKAGFDRRVTGAGLARLSAAALRLVPALADAVFHSAWAGLRPAAPDGLPAIGRAAPGLVYACGHLRNGIVLAPITAVMVGRLLGGGSLDSAAAPFDPKRFA
ncbi:MAG TPA: glycine oxidase ThiO [Verrucomicrobiae bacterium]|nr:glycine oxidase ThiO [Verrucomicrobiae bacterium]